MALPKTRRLSSTALGKVDDEHYRALVIEKAQLPHPANQSGSKRLIVESMVPVGINADVTDIVYAPAPGGTLPGFVTVRLVAQVTESAQQNSKKLWGSHPMGRSGAVALPDIGIFTIGGVTNVQMARLPFGGAGYHSGAFVRGVNLVENRLNEERLILFQEEVAKRMAVTVCDKLLAFESERKAVNEATAADATKSESDRKVARAIVRGASAKIEALSLINSGIDHYFQTFIKPLNPFNVADAFDFRQDSVHCSACRYGSIASGQQCSYARCECLRQGEWAACRCGPCARCEWHGQAVLGSDLERLRAHPRRRQHGTALGYMGSRTSRILSSAVCILGEAVGSERHQDAFDERCSMLDCTGGCPGGLGSPPFRFWRTLFF